jgi:anthranilate/para-aminobenzoate synthase component II
MVQADIEENEPVLQNESDIHITILSFHPESVYTEKELEKFVLEDFLKFVERQKREDKLERLRD